MKILINRKPITGAWGGGNHFVKSFYEFASDFDCKPVSSFSNDLDAILMIAPHPDELGISVNEILSYKSHNPKVKIIHRVNESDLHRGGNDKDHLLRECSKYTDMSIFVSKWIRDYHLSNGWYTQNTEVIYNGVDKDIFKPTKKINNGKINIVTHHWSNNRNKGFDVYEAIDDWISDRDDFTFTYIGRELGTFKNTKVVSPLCGKELAKELGKYDVYISASKYDTGPNHILESIACGLPTYVHKDGGGCVEYAGKEYQYNNVDELFYILLKKRYIINDDNTNSWYQCVQQYVYAIKGKNEI